MQASKSACKSQKNVVHLHSRSAIEAQKNSLGELKVQLKQQE